MAMSSPNSELRTPNHAHRAAFVVFLFALYPAWNAGQPRIDEDTWWHLAVGRHIVDHGFPTHDPFSRISQEDPREWIAYSWLHELLLYAAHQSAGLPGILAVRALLDAATSFAMASLVLRRRPADPLTWLVLALVTLTLVPLMLERPWHYTIVLTVLCLRGAERMQSGDPPGRWWWLPVAFAFWANVHIQFVLGLGVLGLGWLVAVSTRAGFAWRPWLGVGVACAAATLVNPYHVRLYVVVFEYATQTGALRVVQELAPPDFTRWWNWPLLLLLGWGAYSCVRSRSLFDAAFLAVAAFFALRMQRDLWFGAAVAAMVITRSSPTANLRLPNIALPAATLAAFVLTALLGLLVPNRSPREAERLHYPAGAVAFLKRERPPGPIFNHFDTGGYLIWTLPEYPVSIDGRTNLYGEARLERSMSTWQGHDWETDPDLSQAGVVLVPKRLRSPLEAGMRQSPLWRVVYDEADAVIFVARMH